MIRYGLEMNLLVNDNLFSVNLLRKRLHASHKILVPANPLKEVLPLLEPLGLRAAIPVLMKGLRDPKTPRPAPAPRRPCSSTSSCRAPPWSS